MFVDFLFHLRRRGIAVGPTEWLTLMEALSRGLAGESLTGLYRLCRAVCVKDEALYDAYDRAFAEHFAGADFPADLVERVLAWLVDPAPPPGLTPEQLARLRALDLEELRRLFAERLREQRERHDRGSRFLGTGGTSPFGSAGVHPSGVRAGGGGGRTAVQVAADRRFRNLRGDATLDVRQLEVALRALRRLGRDGLPEALDLPATVDATARNAGEIELRYSPERRNTVKLLLLIDVGGSMAPHALLCERLFTAANRATHFRRFRPFFFHNCPYDTLYTDIARRRGEATAAVLREVDHGWACILVGDAAMAPWELTHEGGAIDYWQHSRETGLAWLERIAARVPRSVWLNPDPERYWTGVSTDLVRRLFPMHPLTLDGLGRAIARLRGRPGRAVA